MMCVVCADADAKEMMRNAIGGDGDEREAQKWEGWEARREDGETRRRQE